MYPPPAMVPFRFMYSPPHFYETPPDFPDETRPPPDELLSLPVQPRLLQSVQLSPMGQLPAGFTPVRDLLPVGLQPTGSPLTQPPQYRTSPPPPAPDKIPQIWPPPLTPPKHWNARPPENSPLSSPRPSNNNTLTLVAVLVSVVCASVIIGAAVGVFLIVRKRRQRRDAMEGTSAMSPGNKEEVLLQSASPNPQLSPVVDGILRKPNPQPNPNVDVDFDFSKKRIFTYEELAKATDNFSESNFLGEGGFAYVHKGVLPGGKLVAIKRLKDRDGKEEREFKGEVEIISRVHHKHLVSLSGYCISGAERLLVFQFVPNNTLQLHLHGKSQPPLNWGTRLRIAIGAAKGFAYLHEECQPSIIHRDIKAANILLDHDFVAKVADFGLAKLTNDADTHISTRVMGTFGYLAPEYARTGKVTEKSDIFSFGVVLLELITGHQPIGKGQFSTEDNLVDWAIPLLKQALKDNNYDNLVDPKLQYYDSAEMARMVACACACVRNVARRRPQMSQIVGVLEGNISLEKLSPGDNIMHSNDTSRDCDTQYHEALRTLREMALENTTQGSNPSESIKMYGVQPSGSTSVGTGTSHFQFSSSEGEHSRDRYREKK